MKHQTLIAAIRDHIAGDKLPDALNMLRALLENTNPEHNHHLLVFTTNIQISSKIGQ